MERSVTSTSTTAAPRADSRAGEVAVRSWNRRIHVYLGLYFLLFIWLFSVSGLLLNKTSWSFTSFWEQRETSEYQRTIAPFPASGDVESARQVMEALALEGEINDVRTDDPPGWLSFQAVRPGHIYNIDADPASGRVDVEQIDLDVIGVMDALHKFTGVSMTQPSRERDWALTWLWALSMDALSIGLIALVMTGVYLWWRLPKKRVGGLVALTLGIATCTFFLLGLGRFF